MAHQWSVPSVVQVHPSQLTVPVVVSVLELPEAATVRLHIRLLRLTVVALDLLVVVWCLLTQSTATEGGSATG